MGLRINHNIQAINGHRQLLTNDRQLGKSLEKLSSGMKINRAADGPANLIISEQMRAQIASTNQAIDNSETAISMVQTTESAMVEVANLLTTIRQLAIHAANEGANDHNMLKADQLEITNALNTIDRITNSAQFGVKKLLDGTTGANGVGIGEGVEFVAAGPNTVASPVSGYEVRVHQLGTRAQTTGTQQFSEEIVKGGEEIVISEGGKVVRMTTTEEDTLPAVVGKLKNEILNLGLDVELELTEEGMLQVTHNDYGSDPSFRVSSSTPGVLSSVSRQLEAAAPGQDIAGTIGGLFAFGKGQTLTGADGSAIEGLKVRYTGDKVTEPDAGEDAEIAGRVAVTQQSLTFQVGGQPGQTARFSLVNTNTRVLGRGVENESGYQAIREVDVTTAQGAQDAIRLTDKAIDEISVTRSELGAFQRHTLESNLRQLRINAEELTAAESVIRDADMAKEITEFTRNSIMVQSATAMLAQANQVPQTVLALLG